MYKFNNETNKGIINCHILLVSNEVFLHNNSYCEVNHLSKIIPRDKALKGPHL